MFQNNEKNIRQFKIPRSISTTNHNSIFKKLNNQSMQSITEKLPPINIKKEQQQQRIKTEHFLENDYVKYISAKTLTGQNNKKKMKINQDSIIIKKNICGQNDWNLFGVFDGHGQNGHFISQYISKKIVKIFEQYLLLQKTNNSNDIKQLLIFTFQDIEKDLIENSNIICNFSGSTAILIFIMGYKIFSANVGDSRACFYYKSGELWYNRPLSFDHKPNKILEQKRIIEKGGRVEQSQIDGKKVGPYRVWLNQENIPGLAMSRSIGDLVAKQVGVIAEPEIFRYRLPTSGFIIIGSDGLWDQMDNQSLQKIFNIYFPPINQLDIESTIQRVLGETYQKWEELDNSRDDITIILIYMQLPQEFKVQIVFNNDILNELEAEKPSDEMLDKYRMLYESNTIKLKASLFMEKRKPGRPPKQKPIIEESIEEEVISERDDDDNDNDNDIIDDEDLDEMDIEGDGNLSVSSKEKKFTVRQLHSMGNLEIGDQLVQLPTSKNKQKKDFVSTEEEILIKSMKELQRKEKLQKQQEEVKKQTVDKILNEQGRKQKQRQQAEDKKTEVTHKYRQLPVGDIIIKFKSNQDGTYIIMPQYMNAYQHNKQMQLEESKLCSNCTQNAKYKIPKSNKKACSLECFKLIKEQIS